MIIIDKRLQPFYTLVLDCPGKDSIRMWPLTVVDPWVTASVDYPSSKSLQVGDRAGGIVWSRHNLSAFGPFFRNTGEFTVSNPPFSIMFGPMTTQICVFCHTPHHARTDTAPLWNKDNLATYVAYGPTLAGTSTDVSGSSLACLSCHDGITTFDNIINRPGKGSGYPAPGTTTNDMLMGWTMWDTGAKPAESRADHFGSSNKCGTCHSQSESDRLNIGLGGDFQIVEDTNGPSKTYQPLSGTGDLQNDHPIGISYKTDGRASLRPIGTNIASLSMSNAKTIQGSGMVGNPQIGRSDNYWSVFGYINAGATIGDLLRSGDKVECASCHDPHYKNQTNNDPSLIQSYSRTGGIGAPKGAGYNITVTSQFDRVIDGLFLRRVGGNSNSGVCRTCHMK